MQILSGLVVVPSRPHLSTSLAIGLLIALTGCSNSPTARTLQESLAADPRLAGPTTPAGPSTAPAANVEVQRSDSLAIALRDLEAPSAQTSNASSPQPGDPSFMGPSLPNSTTTAAELPGSNGTQTFTDLDNAPTELRQPLKDLAALGVLTAPASTTKGNSTNSALFEPNKPVTRREYARWLFAANNRLQATRPAQQIRAGVVGSPPAFQDISQSDPDFAAIQGLAEAGILPSPLSGSSTLVTFRPDAPLTRETLVLWKVPLDIRQGLANANVDAVKQTWGFQDAGRIDPQALRAVLADFQNGDQANIRRVFGYTTLFQPKKAVTRAEAATTLWYFGTVSEGISAAEALKTAAPSN